MRETAPCIKERRPENSISSAAQTFCGGGVIMTPTPKRPDSLCRSRSRAISFLHKTLTLKRWFLKCFIEAPRRRFPLWRLGCGRQSPYGPGTPLRCAEQHVNHTATKAHPFVAPSSMSITQLQKTGTPLRCAEQHVNHITTKGVTPLPYIR